MANAVWVVLNRADTSTFSAGAERYTVASGARSIGTGGIEAVTNRQETARELWVHRINLEANALHNCVRPIATPTTVLYIRISGEVFARCAPVKCAPF